MQRWLDIPGYEGRYQASTFGHIRNAAKLVLKTETHYKGHLRVDLCIKGTCIKQYVHRLVAHTFLPNPHVYPLVNHKDLNKKNNNLENLEWCTYEYNTQHYHNNKHLLVSVATRPEDEINGEDIPW